MILYGYYRSSTTYRIRIALNLKQIEYETVAVNLLTQENKRLPYRDLNPFETVPALEHDGDIYLQSMAILQHLEASVPTPSLLPKSQADRQLCYELSFAIATETHAPNNLSVLNYLKENFQADDGEIKSWYLHWIDRTFSPIEERLSAHSANAPLHFDGQPSLFETVLIPQVYNAERFGMDMSKYPILSAINSHCSGLQPFVQAHPEKQPGAQVR